MQNTIEIKYLSAPILLRKWKLDLFSEQWQWHVAPVLEFVPPLRATSCSSPEGNQSEYKAYKESLHWRDGQTDKRDYTLQPSMQRKMKDKIKDCFLKTPQRSLR